MEPEKKSNGAFVGLVVVIIILVVGGIYMWSANKKAQEARQAQIDSLTAEDSTELDSLEADVGSADTNVGVDASTIE